MVSMNAPFESQSRDRDATHNCQTKAIVGHPRSPPESSVEKEEEGRQEKSEGEHYFGNRSHFGKGMGWSPTVAN